MLLNAVANNLSQTFKINNDGELMLFVPVANDMDKLSGVAIKQSDILDYEYSYGYRNGIDIYRVITRYDTGAMEFIKMENLLLPSVHTAIVNMIVLEESGKTNLNNIKDLTPWMDTRRIYDSHKSREVYLTDEELFELWCSLSQSLVYSRDYAESNTGCLRIVSSGRLSVFKEANYALAYNFNTCRDIAVFSKGGLLRDHISDRIYVFSVMNMETVDRNTPVYNIDNKGIRTLDMKDPLIALMYKTLSKYLPI